MQSGFKPMCSYPKSPLFHSCLFNILTCVSGLNNTSLAYMRVSGGCDETMYEEILGEKKLCRNILLPFEHWGSDLPQQSAFVRCKWELWFEDRQTDTKTGRQRTLKDEWDYHHHPYFIIMHRTSGLNEKWDLAAGYKLSTWRRAARKVPRRTPDALGAAQGPRDTLQEEWLSVTEGRGPLPGCWAPWALPPNCRPGTCWVPLNEAWAGGGRGGQETTLLTAATRGMQSMPHWRQKGCVGCSPAPTVLSSGAPVFVSAWGVFTDFFSATVYSQRVPSLCHRIKASLGNL